MSAGQGAWDRLGSEFVARDPAISWSTMMGYPCLRVDGAFFASLDKRTGDLLVKLPADAVGGRVADGSGKPFAPAGKVFREWLAIEFGSEEAWASAMSEALDFVRNE